jgi:large subunit ribosomal protein L49
MSVTRIGPLSFSLRRLGINTLRRSYATQILVEEPISAAVHSPPAQSTSGPVTRTIPLARRPATTPIATSASGLQSLPYAVSRTPTQGLPVYQLAKSGGNLKLTKVRKLSGDIEILRKELEETLTPKPQYVQINPLTNHIMIKVGHSEVEAIYVLTASRATTSAKSMSYFKQRDFKKMQIVRK